MLLQRLILANCYYTVIMIPILQQIYLVYFHNYMKWYLEYDNVSQNSPQQNLADHDTSQAVCHST